jgi:hypothetical protein
MRNMLEQGVYSHARVQINQAFHSFWVDKSVPIAAGIEVLSAVTGTTAG